MATSTSVTEFYFVSSTSLRTLFSLPAASSSSSSSSSPPPSSSCVNCVRGRKKERTRERLEKQKRRRRLDDPRAAIIIVHSACMHAYLSKELHTYVQEQPSRDILIFLALTTETLARVDEKMSLLQRRARGWVNFSLFSVKTHYATSSVKAKGEGAGAEMSTACDDVGQILRSDGMSDVGMSTQGYRDYDAGRRRRPGIITHTHTHTHPP